MVYFSHFGAEEINDNSSHCVTVDLIKDDEQMSLRYVLVSS